MQRTRTHYKEQTERGGYLYPLETYRFHFNLENKNKPQICVSYHWHPELEILMIERGELTVTIEDREYTGKTGDLFFVNPGFLHTMYAREEKNTVYNAIVFDPAFLSFQMYDYVQSHYLAPLLSGRLRFPEKLEKAGTEFPALFQMLRDVLASNEHRYACYQFETKLSLLSAFMTMYRENLFITESERSRKTSPEQVAQIKDILSYIRDHYQEKILLEDIAAYLHLSPKYFSRYFKKQFGRSFTEYVNAFRVEQSLPLLEDSSLSISETAFRCGFESLSYYVKVFKKIMGMTPGEYRISR